MLRVLSTSNSLSKSSVKLEILYRQFKYKPLIKYHRNRNDKNLLNKRDSTKQRNGEDKSKVNENQQILYKSIDEFVTGTSNYIDVQMDLNGKFKAKNLTTLQLEYLQDTKFQNPANTESAPKPSPPPTVEVKPPTAEIKPSTTESIPEKKVEAEPQLSSVTAFKPHKLIGLKSSLQDHAIDFLSALKNINNADLHRVEKILHDVARLLKFANSRIINVNTFKQEEIAFDVSNLVVSQSQKEQKPKEAQPSLQPVTQKPKEAQPSLQTIIQKLKEAQPPLQPVTQKPKEEPVIQKVQSPLQKDTFIQKPKEVQPPIQKEPKEVQPPIHKEPKVVQPKEEPVIHKVQSPLQKDTFIQKPKVTQPKEEPVIHKVQSPLQKPKEVQPPVQKEPKEEAFVKVIKEFKAEVSQQENEQKIQEKGFEGIATRKPFYREPEVRKQMMETLLQLADDLEKLPKQRKVKIRKASFGIIYRVPYRPKISNNQITHTTSFERSNYLTEFQEISSEKLEQTVVGTPKKSAVPRLAHGLERVLKHPGIHPIKNIHDKSYNFDPKIEKIHSPDEVDYDTMAPFVKPSEDQNLKKMGIKQKVKYTGSTSSVSEALTHLYFLFSKFRPINSEALSATVRSQGNAFMKSSSKTGIINLRYHDKGIYSIDRDKFAPDDEAPNQVLIDLGRSLERVLTMEPEDFAKFHLKTSKKKKKISDDLSFHFLKVGDFLFRSQIDCHSPLLTGNSKTFDLKTRATAPVRYDITNYSQYLDYRVQKLTGTSHSFEKEFFDMIRGSFLKYGFQARIGRMAGVFVAYHSTKELFGFEFVSLDEMDHSVYGNKYFADTSFDVVVKLLQKILDNITERFPEESLRLIFRTSRPGRDMEIFVEREGFESSSIISTDSTVASSNPQNLLYFRFTVETFVNGHPIGHIPEVSIEERDKVDIFCQMKEVPLSPEEMKLQYHAVLTDSI